MMAHASGHIGPAPMPVTLDRLVANHRKALSYANSSATENDRKAYLDLVGYYARRIERHERADGSPKRTRR